MARQVARRSTNLREPESTQEQQTSAFSPEVTPGVEFEPSIAHALKALLIREFSSFRAMMYSAKPGTSTTQA